MGAFFNIQRRNMMKNKLYLPMILQFFADDPPTDPPADPPPSDPPAPPETFTAEQLDEARTAAAKEAKATLYKTLGVSSLKELQDRLGAQDKLFEELGVKSIEDIKERLQTAEGKAQTDAALKAENQQLNNRVKDLEIENAFIKSATQHKPHDFDLLFAAVKPLLTTDPDSGQVDNMEEAVKKVKEAKPFLFVAEGGEPQKQPPVPPPPPGAGNPPGSLKGVDLGKSIAQQRNQKGGNK
jgi:hypothetical protein